MVWSIKVVGMATGFMLVSQIAVGTNADGKEHAAQAVAKCDELAASPHDRSARSAPVTYARLRQHASDAVKFCRDAADKDPKNMRAKYQLGRSLIALGKNTEAANQMRVAARGGYPVALNAYGVLLNHGRGVGIDNQAALKFFSEAAAKGNVPAMANLGAMYSNLTGGNAGSVVDREASLKWLNAAANAGDPLAMARLAWNYGMGDGGAKPDKKLAFQWVNRALQQNEESAQYIAIEIAQSGFSDMKLAGKYKKLARGSKNRMALVSLESNMYTERSIKKLGQLGFRFDRPEEEPTHVRQFLFDQDETHVTYLDAMMTLLTPAARKAAEKFIAATIAKRKLRLAKKSVSQEKPKERVLPKVAAETECDFLATSPQDNLALPPFVDYVKLRAHAKKAVSQCRSDVAKSPENLRQKYQLARALIAMGENEEAASFLLQAARAGYPVAMNAYGVLLNHGRGVKTNYKKSFEWLVKAAKANNSPAAINLATAHFMGLGTPVDNDAGTNWTKIGASAGDPKAMFTLGAAKIQEGLWYRSVLVRRNITEGTRLLIMAHKAGDREATYTLYRTIANNNQNRFKVPELVDILEPAKNYKVLMEASGDRRVIFAKLLEGKPSTNVIISAIKEISKLPHPVDQPEREPVYVVESYMDNEWVLGQFVEIVASRKTGVDEELTNAYRELVDSRRSFEQKNAARQ